MVYISIILPVYNAEKTIITTLNSIKKQSLKNYEVLIVDDHSTDNSIEIIDEFLKDTEIQYKILYNKEKGVSSARNYALSNAKGEYIYFLDADDFMSEKCLEVLYNTILRENDLVIGNYKTVFTTYSKNTDLETISYCGKMEMKKFIDIAEGNNTLNMLWNKLFRKSIIDRFQIRFNEELYTGEDFCFIAQYIQQCYRVSTIKDILYFYDRRNGSTTINSYRNDIPYQLRIIIKNKLYLYKIFDFELRETRKYNLLNYYSAAIINIVRPETKIRFQYKMEAIHQLLTEQIVLDWKKEIKLQNNIKNFILLGLKISNSSLCYFYYYLLLKLYKLNSLIYELKNRKKNENQK